MLKITAKIFDPLGITSPFVIRLKMFFQVLCTERLEWDEPLQGELNKTWKCLLEELSIKRQTIPRLELLGATILARLVSTVINSLTKKIDRMVYWVDSRTVLCWIRNEKPWKQYVRNKVDEIRQLTSKRDWRHCPGNVNPADLPSRGMTGRELVDSSIW